MSLFNLYLEPSVFDMSVTELVEWKRTQTRNEIDQLERLIEGHYASIIKLQDTIKILSKDLETEQPEEASNDS